MWYHLQIQILSKTDLTHTGNITQLDTTGKLVTTSILVLPILIINCEIRSHSGSGKRGGICLLPEFTIGYHKVRKQKVYFGFEYNKNVKSKI